MNPLVYIQTMTSDDVQRLLRTALTTLAGALVTHGALSATATWVEPAIGILVFLGTLWWQLYGNRVQAKINEVAKMDINHPTVAAAVAAAPPSDIVTASK